MFGASSVGQAHFFGRFPCKEVIWGKVHKGLGVQRLPDPQVGQICKSEQCLVTTLRYIFQRGQKSG